MSEKGLMAFAESRIEALSAMQRIHKARPVKAEIDDEPPISLRFFFKRKEDSRGILTQPVEIESQLPSSVRSEVLGPTGRLDTRGVVFLLSLGLIAVDAKGTLFVDIRGPDRHRERVDGNVPVWVGQKWRKGQLPSRKEWTTKGPEGGTRIMMT
jgi:hypothetical protein